jgi:Spx/MgsR family transcriptional regulator
MWPAAALCNAQLNKGAMQLRHGHGVPGRHLPIEQACCYPSVVHRGRESVTITIYGIKNCDTMKKARNWLDAKGLAYRFHDYKAEGIDRAHLDKWTEEAGWETVLNRAGTTFRALDEAKKAGLDREKAIALMLEQPSMIKRPVLEIDGKLIVGFKPEIYEGLFS